MTPNFASTNSEAHFFIEAHQYFDERDVFKKSTPLKEEPLTQGFSAFTIPFFSLISISKLRRDTPRCIKIIMSANAMAVLYCHSICDNGVKK